MVKALEPAVAPVVRQYLHALSQDLVQNSMTSMIKHAHKFPPRPVAPPAAPTDWMLRHQMME